MEGDHEESTGQVTLSIDGELDLHAFSPQEATSVVEEYLRACLEKGIREVRIIHGKGRGVLRRTVHACLQKNPMVFSFTTDTGPSGWGATLVRLREEKESG
ncbi:MAG: Smr/MutS family protein [Deltaproteobacteria bacterium]|nr:Smr/MutS family protein [Deltaproteobacteria bacterium]